MGIEVRGRVFRIFETKQVSERFSKREFVVELADNPKYPQLVLFQATGDRCDQLAEFEEGDEIKIEFSLRGREWRSPSGEVKYFNSLDVWKVESVGQKRPPRGAPSQPDLPSAPPIGDDDIPFATCELGLEPSPIAAVLKGTV